MSFVVMLFLVVGAVSAADNINVSDTEDSNLIGDNDDSLSAMDKLEVSSADSISETNIVNSHDDNLEDNPDEVLSINNASDYEDDGEEELSSNDFEQIENDASSSSSLSTDEVIAVSSSNNIVDATGSTDSGIVKDSTKSSTKLIVNEARHGKSFTYFKVTLKDKKTNKSLANQKISLKVNKKMYSAKTNSKGIATVKTANLAAGKYTVSLSYAGNSKYMASSLSKKVKVLSSVIGSNLNKYYGYVSIFNATFWKNTIPLANTAVTFKVNGKTYTKTTNKNGVARLKINLPKGKYYITSTNPFSKEKVKNKIVVKKDNVTVRHGSHVTYIVPGHKYVFAVKLKSKHNVLIKNAKVYFRYNGKTVSAKTNENGKANITIPVLSKGTYKIYYKFGGNKNYNSRYTHSFLKVKNPTTKVSSSTLTMTYKDGSKFKVTLTDNKNKPLAKQTVKIRINGITHEAKTNSKGVAKLLIEGLEAGTHKVAYSYGKKGLNEHSYGTDKIIVKRAPTTMKVRDLSMKYHDGSTYKVIVKDKAGNLLKGVTVKSVIKGKPHWYKTNSKGVAKLKINLGVGYYKVRTLLNDSCYKSSIFHKHILVDGVKFKAHDRNVVLGDKVTFSVKLVDGKSNPIKKRNVIFTFKGKDHRVKTDSKGIAKIYLGKLSKGNHVIKYHRGIFTGSSKIHVINVFTLKQVITASKNVRDYIIDHHKLPSKVKIGGKYYTTAKYFYAACKAIVKLKAGKSGKIAFKNVKGPSSPKSAENLGNLYDYLSVAKKIIKIVDSKGKMPNSVGSKVGTIGYKGAVYALARVVAFYGDYKIMPAYTVVKTLSDSSGSTSKLNDRNTIKKLSAYLAKSTNCQVDNAKFKSLVKKLTKGCTSARQKATAIFNYVRDTVSYSFYYDTNYGALGTYYAKTGNCVDHSHLLVALFRTADLPARYVHGSCTFSSGSTYGHVWTQVLIGNTWTVADATSTRNSFGYVANWNANTYSLHGHYASLPF